jgi:type II secretory pathway component GspD/PulD (secretin)
MGAITGRQVLVDTRVEGTLNLQSNSPVSPAAAWDMFSKSLQHKKLSILSSQGMYIIAPATTDPPPKASPALPAQGKHNTSFQSSSDDFQILLEWAKAPKPTLPQPTGSTAPVQASAEDVSAIWSLQTQDKTLYHSISRWAQSANWQLMWEAERDFPIQAQISIEGSFTAAIQMVMNSLANTDYPLQAVMNNSTRVISVIRHQDPFAR